MTEQTDSVRQQAHQQVEALSQQVTATTHELALQQEHSRRVHTEQLELARIRELEYEHLRQRLQLAEEELKSTKPIIEASAASVTQVDPPIPTLVENGGGTTGALEEPLPATPRVEDPPSQGMELLFPDAEVESEARSPPAKRPATNSPSPLAVLADSHVYPPVYH